MTEQEKQSPRKLALAYGPELLQYDFGPEHPFSPKRALLTWELLKILGINELPQIVLVEPEQATDEDLMLFHTKDYVDFVRSACNRGFGYLDGGDTPAMKGGYEATKNVVGSAWKVVEAVMKGEVRYGVTTVGGLHHAFPGRAGGFCIFNDAAVCIQRLRRDYGLKRIAYIDFDAHHGDGVMYGFYSDPDILTIDFHEDGRYLFPGTGHIYELGRGQATGTKINIPMPPYSGDNSFIHAFQTILPSFIEDFRPEFLIIQMGVDGHGGDPLTDLNYSSASYKKAISILRDLAEQVCDGRLVLLAGGGYSLEACALRWTEMIAHLIDIELPEFIPESWRTFYKEVSGEEAPMAFDEELTTDHTIDRVNNLLDWFREKELLHL